MYRSRPALLSAALAVTAAAVLGACSSSGGGDSSPATSAQLKSTLLTTGDLPAQWVAKPHDTSDDKTTAEDKARDAQLASCIGISKSLIDQGDKNDAAKVYSPDFTLGQSVVSSDAKPKDNSFARAFSDAILTSKKTNSCVQSIFKTELAKSLPSGVTFSKFDVAITKPGSDAPKNARYELALTVGLSDGAQKLDLYFSEVSIQSDRVEASVTLEGFNQPIPAAVRTAALNAVSERVAKV